MKDIKVLLKRKKEKKKPYGRELHKYLSKYEKQKLAEFRKNITK